MKYTSTITRHKVSTVHKLYKYTSTQAKMVRNTLYHAQLRMRLKNRVSMTHKSIFFCTGS